MYYFEVVNSYLSGLYSDEHHENWVELEMIPEGFLEFGNAMTSDFKIDEDLKNKIINKELNNSIYFC